MSIVRAHPTFILLGGALLTAIAAYPAQVIVFRWLLPDSAPWRLSSWSVMAAAFVVVILVAMQRMLGTHGSPPIRMILGSLLFAGLLLAYVNPAASLCLLGLTHEGQEPSCEEMARFLLVAAPIAGAVFGACVGALSWAMSGVLRSLRG